MNRKIKVGITLGDYNGVGPEVALKAIADEMMTDLITPVIFGPARLLEKVRNELGIEMPAYDVVRSVNEIKDGKINIVYLK